MLLELFNFQIFSIDCTSQVSFRILGLGKDVGKLASAARRGELQTILETDIQMESTGIEASSSAELMVELARTDRDRGLKETEAADDGPTAAGSEGFTLAKVPSAGSLKVSRRHRARKASVKMKRSPANF